jgi:peptidyl-dipeptidase Dcp
VIDIKDLSGIPTDILEVAHAKANAKQKEGWLFDLTYPSYIPFMKYADNRALRQQLYMAYNTNAIGGENDNQPKLLR